MDGKGWRKIWIDWLKCGGIQTTSLVDGVHFVCVNGVAKTNHMRVDNRIALNFNIESVY